MQLRSAHKSTYRRYTNWLIYDIYIKNKPTEKTVSIIAWVQLGLFACYSPFCITLISLHFEKVFEREYNLLFPLFTILKLISKPYSLLLENQGGKTGSKGHSSTVKLLLWAKLNLCVMKNNVKLCGKKKTAGLKYKLYSDYWIATWSREDLCIKVTVVILLVYKEWLYTSGDVVLRNICCHHRVTDSPTIGGTKTAKTEPTPDCFLVQTGIKILNTDVYCCSAAT